MFLAQSAHYGRPSAMPAGNFTTPKHPNFEAISGNVWMNFGPQTGKVLTRLSTDPK